MSAEARRRAILSTIALALGAGGFFLAMVLGELFPSGPGTGRAATSIAQTSTFLLTTLVGLVLVVVGAFREKSVGGVLLGLFVYGACFSGGFVAALSRYVNF